MADEKSTGQPEPSPAPPETPQAPAAPTVEIPEKYRGKSPEQLAKILDDQERLMGRQAQELGQARELAESWYQRAQQVTAPPQEPTKPETTDWDYEKPVDSTERIVERKLAERDKRSFEERKRDLYQRTTLAFRDGQDNFKANPKLYEGIEDEVRTTVAQFYAPWIEQGQDVSDLLRRKDVWDTAAQVIRVRRNEFDKLAPQHPKGMSAAYSETPNAARPQDKDDGITIEEDDRVEFEKNFGRKPKNDAEIKEIYRLGAQTYRK